MDEKEQSSPLDPSFRDQLVTIGKAVASVVPYGGGVLGELLGTVVPNQRADRIAAYVAALEARLTEAEANIADLFDDAEKVDLIEEGAFQAVRATSADRIETIATLVSNGLRADDAEIVRRNRLATLLGQIDDDELLVLNAYGQTYGGDRYSAWDAINRPEPTHVQSSVDEIDSEQLYEAGEAHMIRLGLLRKNYGNPPRGQGPAFDTRKGDFEHNVEISYLGRLLLRSIGLPSPYDLDNE